MRDKERQTDRNRDRLIESERQRERERERDRQRDRDKENPTSVKSTNYFKSFQFTENVENNIDSKNCFFAKMFLKVHRVCKNEMKKMQIRPIETNCRDLPKMSCLDRFLNLH